MTLPVVLKIATWSLCNEALRTYGRGLPRTIFSSDTNQLAVFFFERSSSSIVAIPFAWSSKNTTAGPPVAFHFPTRRESTRGGSHKTIKETNNKMPTMIQRRRLLFGFGFGRGSVIRQVAPGEA